MFVSFKKITCSVLKKGTIEVSMVNRYTTTSTGEECELTLAPIGITGRMEGEDRVCRCIIGFMAAVEEASKIKRVEKVYTNGWEEEFIGEKKREFKVLVTLIPS